MKLRCRLGFHKYEDKELSRTKNIFFGFAGCELPGQRIRQKCKFCSAERYVSLNLVMPHEYLYEERLWS
jgi:hypothetical protein